MKKVISICLILFLLFLCPAAAADAETGKDAETPEKVEVIDPGETGDSEKSAEFNYFINELTVLSDEQQAEVDQALFQIGIKYGIDAVILFIDTSDGEHLLDYAERFYAVGSKNNIYQKDGIVLIYSKTEKKWAVYTTERTGNLFTDQEKTDLWDAYLSDGENYDSVCSFMHYVDAVASHFQEKGTQPIPEERQLPRLVDEADLFTSEQEAVLLTQLDEVSARQKCDVVIVTVLSLEGKEPMAFADDFFDYNGYGYGDDDDGILYLLSMEDRDQAYSTYGFAIEAFTDAGQDYIFARMKEDLGNDAFFPAFEIYITLCDEFLTTAYEDEPYDSHNMMQTEEEKKEAKTNNIIAFFIIAGPVLALITLGALSLVERMAAKSGINVQQTAHEYMIPGSFRLIHSDEKFLRQSVRKTRKAVYSDNKSGGRGSKTHTSSSGRKHGGSSNKF